MNTEEWRPVYGHSNYLVSNMGRVRSAFAKPHPNGKGGQILQPSIRRHASGRVVCLTVNLVIERRRYVTKRIHRLVLEAFVGPAPPGAEGCHNDGDPTNNRLSNLRWDSHISNMADSEVHGTARPPPRLVGEAHPMAKLSADAVTEIRSSTESARKLAARFSVCSMTVYRVKRGEARTEG